MYILQGKALITSSETTTSEESDSEYEDAEDGLTKEKGTAAHNISPILLNQESSNQPTCFICGKTEVGVFCNDCHQFCLNCDTVFHNHPARQHHTRRKVGKETSVVNSAEDHSTEDRTTSPGLGLRKYENVVFTKPLPSRLEHDGNKYVII
jgi:hypothetical protein